MDNVKRLIANIMFGVAVMKEHEHGHYVLYDDYAAAEARAEQAEADCAVILKVLNELYSSILDAEQDWSGESNYINYSKQSLEMIVAEESLNMPHPGSALLAELETTKRAIELMAKELYTYYDITDSGEVYMENCGPTIGDVYKAIAEGFLAQARERGNEGE